MGPAAPGENQSQLNVLTVSPGESIVHANKYESASFTYFILFIDKNKC